MAPWPEPHSEPKAPDKTCEETCENQADKHKSDCSEDKELASAQWKSGSPVVESSNPAELSDLDDRQLRALLDEAITYKCPKDREGKSHLFRELLEEAEADESDCRGGGAKRGSGAAGRCRRPSGRRADVSERNTRGGSLQNLVYATNSDLDAHAAAAFGRRRPNRRSVQVNVSARQREGGSLPCNVNVDPGAAGSVGGAALFLEQRAGASRRQHSTVDDISAGAFSYKANSRSKRKDLGPSTTTVDDINTGGTSYRTPNCSAPTNQTRRRTGEPTPDDIATLRSLGKKRGTVDDLVTANSRSAKRKDLKQLGHSSDDIYSRGPDDYPPKFVEDLKKEGRGNGLTADPFSAMLGVGLNGPAAGQGGRRWAKGDDFMDATELMPLNLYGRTIASAVETSGAAAVPGAPSPTPGATGAGRGAKEATASATLNGVLEAVNVDGPTHVEAVIMGSDMADLHAANAGLRSGAPGCAVGLHEAGLLRSETNGAGRGKDISLAVYQQSLQHTAVMSTYIVNSESGGDSDKLNRQRDYCNMPRWRNELNFYQVGDRNIQHLQTFLSGKDLTLDKRNYDENGNAVHHSQTTQRKARKIKVNNNYERVFNAEEIPGNRGRDDVEVLVEYIESDSQDVKTPKARGSLSVAQKDSKHRNSNSNGKRSDEKNRTDKRKGKLKKCNSLEEISRTKFSDLTAPSKTVERRPKKQVTLDNAELDQSHKDGQNAGGGDRRSWGPEGSTSSSSREDSCEESIKNRKWKKDGEQSRRRTLSDWEAVQVESQSLSANDVSTAEFHVVTKKQRKKKPGRSSSIGRERNNHINHNRDLPPRHGRSFCTQDMYQYRSDSPEPQHHRRKSTSSMPPSDKSADSSDLDSVHSLPISPTTPRAAVDKTSTSSGSTPQASYADIARMASSTVSPPQSHKSQWPSVGQPTPAKHVVPLWTANVTTPVSSPQAPSSADSANANAPASTPAPTATCPSSGSRASSVNPSGAGAATPTSQDAAESCSDSSAAKESSVSPNGGKRDAMTNTVSPAQSAGDTPPAPAPAPAPGNLLSDNAYPPLRDCGKSPVNQTVKSFIYQASKSDNTAAATAPTRMANCIDVEHCAKRAASPNWDTAPTPAPTPAPVSMPTPNEQRTARKAVIILDELETDAGCGGDPELTFGFEVNELLLAGVCESSGEEEASCASPDATQSRLTPDVIPPSSAQASAPCECSHPCDETGKSPGAAVTSAVATVNVTITTDATPRAVAAQVSPVMAQTAAANVKSARTSHELQQIVAFVGEAWDEVIKNLSSERGASGPVKYYSDG